MQYFFSVDWGTSSLRVRLVCTHPKITVLNEQVAPYGCKHADTLFNENGNNISREDFYLQFLKPFLLFPDTTQVIQPIPVLISGMAGSSIGIRNLPYSTLPFPLNGNTLEYTVIPRSPEFDHSVILFSGVSSQNDIMRGEEMQLIGLQSWLSDAPEAICILPGTHSKHIHFRDGEIICFKTFITGELFNILSSFSLLKNSVTQSTTINEEAFLKGVQLSEHNLLHTVFTIRAGSVLYNTESSANYSLLSGILIGTELRELCNQTLPIFLCTHGNLHQAYTLAIQELGIQERCTIIPPAVVDSSAVVAQKLMLERLLPQIK